MPGFTVYFANKIIDHCLGGVSWTPPTSVYAKLHIGDPGPDGTANPSTTTTRVEIGLLAAAAGATNLDADLTFAAQTVAEGLSHLSYWDSSTSGNCLYTSELEEIKNLFVGDVFKLPSAPLRIPAEA